MKRLLVIVSFFVLATSALAQPSTNKAEPLAVGATAPDFTLTDSNGKSFTLSQLGRTSVLVFYRGYW